MSGGSRTLKIVLPLALVTVAALLAAGMVALKPDVETRVAAPKPPLVRAAGVLLLQRLHCVDQLRGQLDHVRADPARKLPRELGAAVRRRHEYDPPDVRDALEVEDLPCETLERR